MKTSLGFGKYRDLLFAILLFIVLDLGILFFNFFASIQLERDASRINSAGELRMLTQQITKALLTLQVEKKGEMPIQTSMAQLNQGYEGFNSSLDSLKTSLNQSDGIAEFGADSAGLRETMAKLEKEWRPLAETIQPVVAVIEPTAEDTEIAVNKAVARNLRLMALSDDLAQGVEAAANSKTSRMRQIQVIAIVLALLNFFYIVFKFLRRLNASDRVAEAARREVGDILNTVTEGLLLVHADGRIGSQFSAATPALFRRELVPGQDFRALLHEMLGPERADEASSYLDLLFDPKVKPALLKQLDPLKDVPINSPDGADSKTRFLTFQITQVREADVIKELLITVFDVTEKVELEQELVVSQEAAKSDVEDLIRVLEDEPALLQDFLVSARERLTTLNQSMRDAGHRSGSCREVVGEAAQIVHGIKGEGSALGLSAVSRQAHHMEDVLAPLLQRSQVAGEDLIPVVFELSRLQEQVDRLHRVFVRTGRMAVETMTPDSSRWMDAMVGNLRALSERVALSLSKEVRLTTQLANIALPDAVTQVLREALPQLVRNAVVHGIETPEERQSQGKPRVGELRLEIARDEHGHIEVSLRDDGRGIGVPELRGRVAQFRSDAHSLSDKELIGFIFEPQVTTATEVTEHAGRGVGLSLVRQLVEKAGARLRVMTLPTNHTRFILQFRPAP